MLLRDIARAAVFAVGALLLSGVANAQTFPNKPINLVLGSSAGGSADFGARLYADVLSRNLGQRVVVENRPGGGGIVAAEYIKTQAPDGYVLFQTHSGLPEAMPAMQSMPFDILKDFTYITPTFKSDSYLVVRSDLPIRSLADYVAYAKAQPAGITAGDSAISGPPALTMHGLRIASGANIIQVTYKASQEIITDMLGGRLDSSNTSYLSLRPMLEAAGGPKARILVVASDVRAARFPDVPTMAEAGYPGVAVAMWWGVLGPPGMPSALVERLNAEFVKASRDPDLIRKFAEQDIEPKTSSPSQFLSTTAANQEAQGKIIRALGLKAQ